MKLTPGFEIPVFEIKFEITVAISRDFHCSDFRDKKGLEIYIFQIPIFQIDISYLQ